VAAGDVVTASIVALVGDYIALRHGLGYRSASQERALRAFARYLDQARHDGPIPLESSLDWAASTTSTDPCNPARRLTTVRGFLRHLAATDGATEVPAPGLLGPTVCLPKRASALLKVGTGHPLSRPVRAPPRASLTIAAG
jgi:hypothetical protein